jgi:vitamin K-dependent gamma-carboxylase
MHPRRNYWLIGEVLQQPWVHTIIGTAGILFDLLIIPALLWKPTRKAAFLISIFFHLFNSFIFQIGIFPYLALAFSVFFFGPETIRSIFFKSKEPFTSFNKIVVPNYKNNLLLLMWIYFIVQLLLPVRHYVIEDNILWTEEGHRMSWRMMLRSRVGKGHFKIVDKNTWQLIKIIPKTTLRQAKNEKCLHTQILHGNSPNI